MKAPWSDDGGVASSGLGAADGQRRELAEGRPESGFLCHGHYHAASLQYALIFFFLFLL